MQNPFFKKVSFSADVQTQTEKPVSPWLKKLPNRLTYLRILCIPIVVYLLTYGDIAVDSWQFWHVKPIYPSATDICAAIIFAIAAITDFFDGLIARHFHVETMLGKLLDPLADKLLVVSAMIILVEKHRMEGWIAVVLIVRDLGINAIRLAAMDEGISIPSNFIGKTKTALLDIGIVGLIVYGYIGKIPFHYVGRLFIACALAVSLISAIQYLHSYGVQLKKKSQLSQNLK